MSNFNTNIKALVLITTVSIWFLMGCTQNSGGSNSSTAGTLSIPYQVNNVVDHGLDAADGTIHIELDGTFNGVSDSVSVTCQNGATPTVAVINDSPSQILLTLSVVTDSCTFTVLNTIANSSPTSSISISNQTQLSIFSVSDNGVDGTITTDNDYALAGTFVGLLADQIYAGCDGNAPSLVTITSNGGRQVDIIMPTPLNFTSCQFYVTANGVQSPTFLNMSISSVTSNPDGFNASNTDIQLLGNFIGSNDQVFAACDGNAFAAIPSAIYGASEIDFQMPTPANSVTCQYYVANGSLKTATYYSMLIKNSNLSDNQDGTSNLTLNGSFIGTSDQVSVGCDDSPLAPISASNFVSDSVSSITVTIPTPVNVYTCYATVSTGGAQTPLFQYTLPRAF
jgi:hypothetical protein